MNREEFLNLNIKSVIFDKWKSKLGYPFNFKDLEEFENIIDYYERINQELKKQLENCFCNRTDCSGRIKDSKTYYSLEQKIENQQKEFIEYMNKTIEELECDDVDDEEMKGYLIQRIDTFKEVLSKYKGIIGGKDE